MMAQTQRAGSMISTSSLSPLAVPFQFSSNSALGFAQDPYGSGSNLESLSSLNMEDGDVDYLHYHYDIPVGTQEETCFSNFSSVEFENFGDYDVGYASNSDLLTSKEVSLPMCTQGFENLGVAASFGNDLLYGKKEVLVDAIGSSCRKEIYAGDTVSNDSLLKGDHVAGGLNSCKTSDCIPGRSAAILGRDTQISQDQVQKDSVSTPSVIPSCQGVLAKILSPSVDSCAGKFKAIPETQLSYPPCVVSGRKFDLNVSPEDRPLLQADSYKCDHVFGPPETPSPSVIAVEKSSSTLDHDESDLDSPCWKGKGIETSGSLFQSFELGQSQQNKKEKAVLLNPLAPEFLPRSVEGKENAGNAIVHDGFSSLLDSSLYHTKFSFGECEPLKAADVEPCPFDLKRIKDVVKKNGECESKCGNGIEKPTVNNSIPDDCIQEICISKALTCVNTTSKSVGDSDSDSLNSHRHETAASPLPSDVSVPGHWGLLKNEKTNRLNPLASHFVPAAAGRNSYLCNEHPKDGFQIISTPSPMNISCGEHGLSKTKMKTNSYGSNVIRIEYSRDNHDREKEIMIQHCGEDHVTEKASSVYVDEKRSSLLNSSGRSQPTSSNDLSTFNDKSGNVRCIGDSLQGMEEALQVERTVASSIATNEALNCSLSGAGSIDDLIEKLMVLSNSMSSSSNVDIQNVITTMGVLSELLVQNDSHGSDFCSESQSDIIQHIINNLSVYRKNHCGRQNVMAESVHTRSQYCLDKSNDVRSLGKALEEVFAEDEKMQALAFRNLWLDTEAEMCMRKYETYL